MRHRRRTARPSTSSASLACLGIEPDWQRSRARPARRARRAGGHRRPARPADQRQRPRRRRVRLRPPPRSRCSISNDASDSTTMIDVRAPDGPAVLYRLSHALVACRARHPLGEGRDARPRGGRRVLRRTNDAKSLRPRQAAGTRRVRARSRACPVKGGPDRRDRAATARSDRVGAFLAGADADQPLDVGDPDLAVTDLAGGGRRAVMRLDDVRRRRRRRRRARAGSWGRSRSCTRRRGRSRCDRPGGRSRGPRVTVMPMTPAALRASLTSSSLNGLTMR